MPAWAAGFSAFGCACADFEYRYDKSVDIALPRDAADEAKAQACVVIEEAWKELAAKVAEEFVINGFKPEEITLLPGYRMQYMGQLNDIEITSPISHADQQPARDLGRGQYRRRIRPSELPAMVVLLPVRCATPPRA